MPYRIAWALLETERDTFREAYWELAMVARDLLQWLSRIPGSDTRDAIDGEKSTAWLAEVRALCVRYGRAEAGDPSSRAEA